MHAVVIKSPSVPARVFSAQALLSRFEDACTALEECIDIAGAKRYADASEALSVLGKIHNNPDAERKARALKLLAFRKASALAKKLRPDSPTSLLVDSGFTPGQANTIRRFGRLPAQVVQEAAAQPRPPAPTVLLYRHRERINSARATDAERIFLLCKTRLSAPCKGADFTGAEYVSAKELAFSLKSQLGADEVDILRQTAQRSADWLDEFLQHTERKR